MPASSLQELLKKEMTRKEFLMHLGMIFLVLSGISSLLKTLNNPHLQQDSTFSAAQRQTPQGFRSGVYGG